MTAYLFLLIYPTNESQLASSYPILPRRSALRRPLPPPRPRPASSPHLLWVDLPACRADLPRIHLWSSDRAPVVRDWAGIGCSGGRGLDAGAASGLAASFPSDWAHQAPYIGCVKHRKLATSAPNPLEEAEAATWACPIGRGHALLVGSAPYW
ncbi:hypothetical protein K523DRAFT_161586 [Schizophyllum commune Tattone D]|nr:hypothetical protein K523DRAFT_161586 [Schizophyllum commune Tattone D]